MPREPHLLDYLIILRKHQWLILAFLLTVVTVVTIASFKMKPVYEATARVEVDKESQNTLPFQGVNYDEYVDMEIYISTQIEILQSETLALQTIKSLNLDRYPEFAGSSGPFALPHGGAEAKRPAILGAFLGRLHVKRIPNSRLVEVQFESEDPQLAALVANTHLQNYIEQNFRSKYDATTQASKFLSGELEELRIKVESSENARIAYERQNQIWQIDEKQNITTQTMGDLNRSVTEAQTNLATKEAIYRMATSGNVDLLPEVRNSPVIEDLLKRRTALDDSYTEALNQYGPNFPKVRRLAEQKREADEDMARAQKTMVGSIEEDYKTASQHLELLARGARSPEGRSQ